MEIKTKFDCGQHVWLMFENRPIEMIVIAIKPCDYIYDIDMQETRKVGCHMYNVKPIAEQDHSKKYPSHVQEWIIFATKKELVMSLL